MVSFGDPYTFWDTYGSGVVGFWTNVVVVPPGAVVVVPEPALTWLTVPTLLDAPSESWAKTLKV